jgi:uncharacterized protein
MAGPQRVYDGFLPGLHPIEAYGSGGFRFGGMSHRGSILVLPSGIRKWEALALADCTIEGLLPLLSEKSDIDLVLFGLGAMPLRLPAAISARLGEETIRFETMSTSSAAMTYNVLLQENRRAAACLLAIA